MHGRFGTSVVILPGKTRVDIATARTETYSAPGALPDVSFDSIRNDLKRRDFSINAMAVSLNPNDFGDVADFFSGQSDLKAGIIRSLYTDSFTDDPTRILRAVRFESALGFAADAETEDRLRKAVNGGYLSKVSGARLRKEIFAIADGPAASAALRRLGELNVWTALVPEMKPGSAAYKTIADLEIAEASLAGSLKTGYKRRFAVLTALLMDSGPDAAAAFCCIINVSRFRASRISSFAKSASGLIASIGKETAASVLHGMLIGLSEESLAVLWSSGGPETRQGVERFMAARTTKPLITGRDLIRWGYPPSKTYADILSGIFGMQLDGIVKNRSEAKAAVVRKSN